jgi:hypothetical protein
MEIRGTLPDPTTYIRTSPSSVPPAFLVDKLCTFFQGRLDIVGRETAGLV